MNKPNYIQNKLLLSSCVLAFGLSASAFANTYENSASNSTTMSTSVMRDGYGTRDEYNENRDRPILDEDLKKKIRDKIGSGWFQTGYDQMIIDVRNGVVVIEGTVDTWDDKDKIEKDVRNLNGVKNLNSRISVRESRTDKKMEHLFPQDQYATTEDEQLNKRIRNEISIGWLWDSYKNIGLTTADGIVTLTGTVDRPSDQQKLVSEIQKIQGVRGIKSTLIVKNP